MNSVVRRLVGIAALVALLPLVGAIAARRRVVAAVPAELRSPALWIPGPVTGERSLKFVRVLIENMPAARPLENVFVEVRETDRRDGGRIRILLHDAEGRRRPSGALLWIHGGGLVLGRPEQSVDVCNRAASDVGIVVANIDYRLAPENPFPAGLDDCVDALRWLHANAEELGIDSARIAVGGDSAGGGLAAAVSQRAHDEGIPLAFQALVYPMLDDRTVLQADHAGRGSLVWTPACNEYAWSAYLGHRPSHDELAPYAAPARREDLSGLPPAWIGVGDLDLFYEEDVEYARRLETAGVRCELHVLPGAYHGADIFAAKAASSLEFHDRFRAALREAIGSEVATSGR
jgi:acetyl esterase/lipase